MRARKSIAWKRFAKSILSNIKKIGPKESIRQEIVIVVAEKTLERLTLLLLFFEANLLDWLNAKEVGMEAKVGKVDRIRLTAAT